MLVRRWLVVGTALAAGWWWIARPLALRWGATKEERDAPLPGDALAPDPDYETTRAITISAPPHAVWPWLVQIGKGRGGLYSLDFLDRLFGFLDAPSADVILPEWQDLQPGDVIPLGRGPGWPVVSLEAEHSLVLGGEDGGTRWSWAFALNQKPDASTRLISRNRVSVPSGVGRLIMLAVVEPPAFIMTWAMLRGIRRRAEALARVQREADGVPN